MGVLARIRDRTRYILAYRRALALTTPLIEGRETRRVANALRFDHERLKALPESVPFEPRNTFAERALEWARG